jgi:hypothetical protein
LETLGEDLRKRYRLSKATAQRLAEEITKYQRRVWPLFCFWMFGKVDCATYPSERTMCLTDSFEADVKATRAHVRHLRVCAIIALRRAGLHKDAAVYMVRHHTPFWDDMDPIERIALRAKLVSVYYWWSSDDRLKSQRVVVKNGAL